MTARVDRIEEEATGGVERERRGGYCNSPTINRGLDIDFVTFLQPCG